MMHDAPLHPAPPRVPSGTACPARQALLTALLLLLVAAGVVTASPGESEPVDLEMVTRIRDEGLNRSQVMDTLAHLCEVIGPRLTGSPQMKAANDWTLEALAGWGLENPRLESWGPFGRGWSYERASVHMVAPHKAPLLAVPRAWTPGTRRRVKGEVMAVKMESEKDFEKFRGKLAGKVLLMGESRPLEPRDTPRLDRHTEDELAELTEFPIPGSRQRRFSDFRGRRVQRWRFGKALREFLTAEKALAILYPSFRDAGILIGTGGGSRQVDEEPGPTSLTLSAEDFNLIHRILGRDVTVELEIEVTARFHDEDLMAYNSVAEIPGQGSEVVMLGGHLDSWHTGCGATDNAAGVAVAMEAVRILSALGVEPRRTIRIALWSGEEQGLLGSRAYVEEHFAWRSEEPDAEDEEVPQYLRRPRGPLQLRPDHDRLSAYFNLDNGSGRIRGIYAQENAAVVPIFQAWLRPFADLGATTVTLRNTSGTDHLAFDAVGLPGFQFIQDGLEYRSLTHHTNMDVFDRLERDDLMQASVIMAAFVYHAAMREERLPRKPLPPDPETAAAERSTATR